MATFPVTLPGGRVWTPLFIANIDAEECTGCGRCIETCAHDVLQLMAIGGYDGYEKKFMSIAHSENCIGCEACGRNCSKRCISFAAAETDAAEIAFLLPPIEAYMATIAAASA